MKICPKCGTKVEYFGMLKGEEYYYCPHCQDIVLKSKVKEKNNGFI